MDNNVDTSSQSAKILNNRAMVRSDSDRMTTLARTVPGGASYNLHEQSDVSQRAYLVTAALRSSTNYEKSTNPHGDRESSIFDRGNTFQAESDLTPAPVSRLYSFGGQSLFHQR